MAKKTSRKSILLHYKLEHNLDMDYFILKRAAYDIRLICVTLNQDEQILTGKAF